MLARCGFEHHQRRGEVAGARRFRTEFPEGSWRSYGRRRLDSLKPSACVSAACRRRSPENLGVGGSARRPSARALGTTVRGTFLRDASCKGRTVFIHDSLKGLRGSSYSLDAKDLFMHWKKVGVTFGK